MNFVHIALIALIILIPVSSLASMPSQGECKHPNAVCLDNKIIFWLNRAQVAGGFSPVERAKQINERIKNAADNPGMQLDDLTVEDWAGGTVVKAPTGVILSILDQDIKAIRVSDKDRQRLAKQYLERIKHSIRLYREKYALANWLKRRDKGMMALALIGFLLVLFGRFFYTLTGKRFPVFWSVMAGLMRFTINSFGRLIEVLLYLALILLLFRLSIGIFAISRATLFTDVLAPDFDDQFKQVLSILKILGLLSGLGIFTLFFHWLSSRQTGTLVLPFNSYLPEENSSSTSQLGITGKGISNSLITELNRIRHIHTSMARMPLEISSQINQMANLPPLFPIQESIENDLANIGTIDIGKAKIPIGLTFLGLRMMWPFGGVNKIITGDLQKVDGCIRLIVRLRQHQEIIMTWDVVATGNDVNIYHMINEIAYKVSIYLAPQIHARTWEAFKYLTEALACFEKYLNSGEIDYLHKAKSFCIHAHQYEQDYGKVGDLLYEIGQVFYERKLLEDAEATLLEALKANPRNKYVHNALGNICLHRKDFRGAENQFRLSLHLSHGGNFAYPYNGLGNVYQSEGNYRDAEEMYLKAIKLNKNFARAHHNLGNTYLYHFKNLKKARNSYAKSIKCSNKRLHYPFVGLSMVFFYKALEDSRKSSALLQQARIHALEAISLEKSASMYWNLGMIEYVMGSLAGASAAWGTISRLPEQKDNEHNLMVLIAEFLNASINSPPTEEHSSLLDGIKSHGSMIQEGIIAQYCSDLNSLKSSPENKLHPCFDLIIARLSPSLQEKVPPLENNNSTREA
jgi:tetratricopeptide (TPR) repeat protein